MLDGGHVALALAFGGLIGLSLGALGAGGSILTVPILVYAMGVPVQTAAGTSLAIVGLNAAAGAAAYLRSGRTLLKTGLLFGVSGLLSAFAGAWLNHQLRGELIMLLFAGLMVAAAGGMLRKGVSSRTTSVAFVESYSAAGWARLVGVGLAIGFLTGFFGVGGGFLIVPALVLVIGVPMGMAVGTSLLVIALNALWGLLGYLRLGGLDWALTLLFVAGGLLGVMAGRRLAERVPERRLRLAFALLILGIAAYTFASSARALLAVGGA